MGFEICNISPVYGWTPLTNFLTFQIRANAGEHFVLVNNRVKKICEDIDQLITDLGTLKTKMGENFGATEEGIYKKITIELGRKQKDLITKNRELFEACNTIVDYVYANKASRADEAAQVANTIANISIYQGTSAAS